MWQLKVTHKGGVSKTYSDLNYILELNRKINKIDKIM